MDQKHAKNIKNPQIEKMFSSFSNSKFHLHILESLFGM
jgi:hypothetical protein